tara:strand:+ start:185 stop:547 length:363 start_codon:yes stop_codon:yes gene_type:complete
MPRLVPNSCREERITLGTYERGLVKDYIQFQKNKNTYNNLTQITTSAIAGFARVAASVPLIVAAWVAKEVVTDEDVREGVLGFFSPLWPGNWDFRFRDDEGNIQQAGFVWLNTWFGPKES